METPLIAVSGIYGINYEKIIQSRKYVGAVVTKSVTRLPRAGNPEPRIVETRAGLLNSIGLQNAGIKAFLEQEIPELRSLEVPVIASVAGSSINEYVECAAMLAVRDEIEAIELNVSCPNVEAGGIEFGCSCEVLEHLVTSVRKSTGTKTLIVKLTPNVTDIAEIAQAAINGGADVLALINTLRGMTIDLNTQKPTLGNRIGGLSGISIHPVAVYMVYRCFTACCKKANIPIIGIGGVSNHEEALELILAGATSVGIGTALFRNPTVFQDITEGISNYLTEKGVENINSLIGKSAYHSILSFNEIATFLNINEEKVRTLCDQRVLPGSPSSEGWGTTLEELESWYLQFTGQQWADLVKGGILEPIGAEINLGDSISSEKLTDALQEWQKSGIAEVIEQRFGSKGSLIWKLRIIEKSEINKQHAQDIRLKRGKTQTTSEVGKIQKSVLDKISTTLEDKLVINKHLISLYLKSDGTLRLETQDNLGYLLQRDREIIRYFMGTYLSRLVQLSRNI